MTIGDCMLEFARERADSMSATQLYRLCLAMEGRADMATIAEAISRYFYDDIDEIDYTKIKFDENQ